MSSPADTPVVILCGGLGARLQNAHGRPDGAQLFRERHPLQRSVAGHDLRVHRYEPDMGG